MFWPLGKKDKQQPIVLQLFHFEILEQASLII